MNIDLDDLKPLADIILVNGVPLLANLLLPGVGGSIASAVVPSIAAAFGLTPAASVTDLTTAIAADPAAAVKLAAVQDKHAELLNFAKDANDASQAALALEGSFGGRFFVGGWRPAMGWIGVAVVFYQGAASASHLPLLSIEMFGTILALWAGLAGIRGFEKVSGVARDSFAKKAK